VRNAQQAQARAMSGLKYWFKDWATTLRSVFGNRECVILGLSGPRRTGSGNDDVIDQGDPAETSQPAVDGQTCA
jgi:hypothetical protein